MTNMTSPLRLFPLVALLAGTALLAGCGDRETKTTTTERTTTTAAPPPVTSSTTTTTIRETKP
jgi:ABC-type uncharacterized transport system auxiliary subunit